MKGLWRLFAPAVFLAALAPFSGAAAQSAEPIDRWSDSAITAALEALKAADIKTGDSGGHAMVTARTREGLSVGVYAKACDPKAAGAEAACRAMEAILSFEPAAGVDRRGLAERLNHEFALGKFMAEPDGSIRLSRYLVFDGGMTPANLRAELASLFAIGALTGQIIWPETVKH
jgi:hypothetical protein